MNQEISKSEKQLLGDRYITGGESVTAISKETGISRSTLYSWIKQFQDKSNNVKKEITVKNFRILENKVERLEGMVEILKTVDCSTNAPLKEKLYALEKLQGQYSVHMLCEALDVPRGTYYNHIMRNK